MSGKIQRNAIKVTSYSLSHIVPWLLLFLLALIWGSSFILMKKGLQAFSPLQIGALREIIAVSFLLPFAIRKHKILRSITPREWLGLASVGLLGNAIPAFLFPLAETRLNSATAGMLNALTPVFVLLIGYFFFQLNVYLKQIIGLLIALSGSMLLILFSRESVNLSEKAGYALLVILATCLYGLSANIMKQTLKRLDPISTTTLALGFAAIPYLFYLVTSDIGERLQQAGAVSSLAYVSILAIVGTAISTVLFNRLIQMTDAVFATSVTYLIPFIALMWGVLSGEPISWVQIGALFIILLGIYIINRKNSAH